MSPLIVWMLPFQRSAEPKVCRERLSPFLGGSEVIYQNGLC